LTREICWILEFAKPQIVLVDREYKDLVQGYKCKRIIVDDDVDGTTGEYEDIVRKGRAIDAKRGAKGWDDLVIDDIEETDTMILNCTSGTTSNPKVPSPRSQTVYLIVVCGNNLSRDISRRNDKYHRVRVKFCHPSWTRRM